MKALSLISRRLPPSVCRTVYPVTYRFVVRLSSSAKPPHSETEYHDVEDQAHQVARFHDLSFMRSFHDEDRFEHLRPEPTLKKSMTTVNEPFAVEGPDGISDDAETAEFLQAQETLDEAVHQEDLSFVRQLRQDQQNAKTIFAVDAPTGESDDLFLQEKQQIDSVIDRAATYEDSNFVKHLHEEQVNASKIFAVDAPDGEADDIRENFLHEVDYRYVVEHTNKHEDRRKVIQMHEDGHAVKPENSGGCY